MSADTPNTKASAQTRKRRGRYTIRTMGEGFKADTMWRVPAAVISAAACPSRLQKEKALSKKDIEFSKKDKFIKIVYGCGHRQKKSGGIYTLDKFGW
eukprot:COSAG05_NODE_7836_length_764_cov_1.592481_1_plen_97_part_00